MAGDRLCESPDVEVPSDCRQLTICLTGEELIISELPPLASSVAARWRHGRVTSQRQRVDPWVPVMPLNMGPSEPGGDMRFLLAASAPCLA
jgi:hypothetical protein